MWLTRNTTSLFAGLLIAERLRRLRARSPPRGIDRRQQREQERHAGDPADVAPAQLTGNAVDVVDRLGQELVAGEVLDAVRDRGQVDRQCDSANGADHDTHEA